MASRTEDLMMPGGGGVGSTAGGSSSTLGMPAAGGGTLSGWLQKQEKRVGLGKPKYRKCWFVLSSDKKVWNLSHYEHGTNMREFVGAERLAQGERNVAPLASVKAVRFVGQKGNKFEVLFKDGSESLMLRAVNADVCNRWVVALADLLNLSSPGEQAPKKTGSEYTDYSVQKGTVDKRRERESVKVVNAFLQDSEIFMSSARKFTATVNQRTLPTSKARTLERKKKKNARQTAKATGFEDLDNVPPPPPAPPSQTPLSATARGGARSTAPSAQSQKKPARGETERKKPGTSKFRCRKEKRLSAPPSTAAEADVEADKDEEDVPHPGPPLPPQGFDFTTDSRRSSAATDTSSATDSAPISALDLSGADGGDLTDKLKKKKKDRARMSLKLFSSIDRPKAATIVSADTLKRKHNLSGLALSPKAFSGGVVQRKPEGKGPRLAVLPMMRSPHVELGLTDIKSDAVKQLIKETIDTSISLSGMLFHDLDRHAMNELVERMYRVDVRQGHDVIKQGHTGDKFYVISEGRFHFYTKRGEGSGQLPELVAENGPRTFFGELALLYEQPSPVSVRAVTDGVLWAISRPMFSEIQKAQARKRQGRKLRLLNNVDVLSDNLDEADIIGLSEAMEERHFEAAGTVVLEEGHKLDKVIIVGSGVLDVIVKGVKAGELRAGDTFGEWALLERASKADVKLVAGQHSTTILTLDVEEFEGLVGPLREHIKAKWAESVGAMFPGRKGSTTRASRHQSTKRLGRLGSAGAFDSKEADEVVHHTLKTIKEHFTQRNSSYRRPNRTTASSSLDSRGTEFAGGIFEDSSKSAMNAEWEACALPCDDVALEDLEALTLLGKGSFGRVHLVRKRDASMHQKTLPQYMALKVLSRDYIQSHGWTEMVENERHAMAELGYLTDCPFVVRLFSAFYDKRNVYFLMELLDGGDMYAVLRKQDEPRVSEKHAKFYVAAIIEALTAVHSRGIIYRDLKPENLFLCSRGYARLADFGLAKKSQRTYTVCGTPDYMAPEIILGRGHDLAADWWAVGVFIFEITTGVTPFCGREPMDIYESVLAHEDGFLVFPDFVPLSKECKSIVSKLLNPKQSRRLAAVRAGLDLHPWFTGFNWDKLRDMSLPPPIKIPKRNTGAFELPSFKNSYDARFDAEPVDKSGWVPKI